MGVQIQGDTGNVIATKGTYSGNVTIGGTLTYEDVTNIDSVGLITAREGIEVGASPGVAASISVDGNAIFSGITTIGGNIKVGTGVTLSPDGDVFFTGVATGNASGLTNIPAANITGTLPAIDGSSLTGIAATDNVRTGILDVAGIATFRDNANVIRINDTQVGGYRNMVTNGDNLISQRYLDTSNTGYVGTVDMFRTSTPGAMSATKQRVADAPAGTGLYYSLKITNGGSTYGSSSTNTIFHQLNSLEGYKTRMLSWGTSSAKPVTLSFYVKSSQTGTFAVAIGNNTGEAFYEGTSRTFISSYTVSSASTWERKTITFDGDTSGTWVGIGTGGSLCVVWDLGSGSSYQGASTGSWQSSSNFRFSGAKSLGDAASATWQITGIQLEIGRQATDFEHKDYDDVLNECRRHFQTWYYGDMNGTNSYSHNVTGSADNNAATLIATGIVHDSDDIHVSAELCPNMRSAIPNVNDFTDVVCLTANAVHDNSTMVQGNYSSRDRINLHIDNEGGMSGGDGAALILKNNGSKFSLSCEI